MNLSFSHHVFLFFTILLCIGFYNSYSQDYAEIKFEDNSLKTDPLPYGKKIKITGSADGADSIYFHVIDKKRPFTGVDMTGTWKKKNANDNDTQFEIKFDTPLKFKSTYEFKYVFVKELGDVFFDSLMSYSKQVALKSIGTNDQIDATQFKINFKEYDEKLVSAFKVQPKVTDDAERINVILKSLGKTWIKNISLKTEREDDIEKWRNNNPKLLKFIPQLEKMAKEDPDDDKDIVQREIELKSIFTIPSDTVLIDANIDFLNEQIEAYIYLNKSNKVIDESLPKVKTEMRKVLKSVYKNGIVKSESDIAVTELEAVMIGTSFGFGRIKYNSEEGQGQSTADLFTYFAFKFYLFPVDKGLKNAYLSEKFFQFWYRMYGLVGMVTSTDLEFKNQKLENTGLGIKPVLGAGVDLNRFISIESGMVMYNQPSISPAIDHSNLQASWFISLSFDVDIINSLSKRDKYYSK
ncbi:hypothetical protein [Reichenbachiella versicolor]|uniref:hypothetical protein n=1 Tax=Reichenbachiella versicolor TaxID=1821036 RepID=UPI000D6E80A1|nr:hypothetical protein [Reichenbachiella versicolor]